MIQVDRDGKFESSRVPSSMTKMPFIISPKVKGQKRLSQPDGRFGPRQGLELQVKQQPQPGPHDDLIMKLLNAKRRL